MEDPRILTIAAALIAYALLSRQLGRWWISMPATMVLIGYLVGPAGLDFFNLSVNTSTVRTVAEITLALMLFHDAARIRLRSLWRESTLPARLLGIGLPAMIVLGTLVGYLMFPSLGWVGAALVATMLAPTDAALGEQVVTNERLPAWLRQGLNVESGLNDGMSVPVFLVLIVVATAGGWAPGALGAELARQIGFGVVSGLLVGGVGGWLMRRAKADHLMRDEWLRIGVVALALASYVLAATLHGSGFIGAFVGGLTFGWASRLRGAEAMAFTGHLGEMFDAVSFVLLGAVLVPLAIPYLSWQVVAYAVLSLVVIRTISVLIAVSGTRAAWQTKLFMGWFGPRGLATVVFTMLLLDEAVPNKGLIAAIAVTGVVLSVYAHGFTAPWLAGAYSGWYGGSDQFAASAPEEADVSSPHLRRSDLSSKAS
jgi:NhaP-type Na+/H+ or K+/H+ antiporter